MFNEAWRKELDPQPPANQSRREFLKKVGLVGAGLAAGEVARRAWSGLEEVEAKHNGKQVDRLLDDFQSFREEFESSFGPYSDLTPRERDQLREEFLEVYGPELEGLMQSADESGRLQEVYTALAIFGCHGKVYEYLAREQQYQRKDELLPKAATPDMTATNGARHHVARAAHFQVRASDFLPTAQQLAREEVDPRLELAASDTKVADTLSTTPGWSHPDRVTFFGQVLDDPVVREVLQNSDCTLAEAYSVIKSVIQFQVRHAEMNLTDAEVAERMLIKRERFKRSEILGPKTDQFIAFTFHEPGGTQFDPQLLENLADSANVSPSRRTVVDTSDPALARMQLAEAMLNASGRTTIYFDTHGTAQELGIRSGPFPSAVIDVSEIAWNLITNILVSENPDALKEMRLILSTCNSYDFTENLVAEMRSQYEQLECEKTLKVPFEAVYLPSIITGAQEGSLAYSTPTLEKALPAIEKEGRFTGEHILRLLQPVDYRITDFTVFEGRPGGIEEIAALQQERRDPMGQRSGSVPV